MTRLARLAFLFLVLTLPGCLGKDDSYGPPASLEVVDGNGQTAKVGTQLLTKPRVRVLDDNGTPVPGTVVVFSTEAGSGTVVGGTVTADSLGIAEVGSWTLGTVVGEQHLIAQVQSLQIQTQFFATATSGSASGINGQAPTKFAALTSTQVTPLPTVVVLDQFGNPQVGTEVTFTVTLGNGTVTGGTAQTNAQGRATVGSWTLGLTAGLNRLRASIATGGNFTFEAMGLGTPPTQLVIVSEASQAGPLGFQVLKTPRVAVKNAQGQLLTNVPVTFTLVSGGDATISGATPVSGTDGVAALGDWKLGSVTTSSSVQATIPGFPGPVALFQATGTAKPFTIDLRLLTAMTANQRDAFVSAATRWMAVVTGGLNAVPNIAINTSQCGLGTPAFNGSVQNLVIFAQAVSIDGVGGVLGSAGPCVVRTVSRITAIGTMRLDAADLADLDAGGRLEAVITHEMAHVLGFGTNWFEKGLVSGQGGTDPFYTGAAALTLWPTFSMAYSGTPIPLENEGGSGTRDAHWRKSVFGPELMTGYISSSDTSYPLSKLSLAVMSDLGYTISYSPADSYRGNLWAGLRLDDGIDITPGESVERARFEVSSTGTVSKIGGP